MALPARSARDAASRDVAAARRAYLHHDVLVVRDDLEPGVAGRELDRLPVRRAERRRRVEPAPPTSRRSAGRRGRPTRVRCRDRMISTVRRAGDVAVRAATDLRPHDDDVARAVLLARDLVDVRLAVDGAQVRLGSWRRSATRPCCPGANGTVSCVIVGVAADAAREKASPLTPRASRRTCGRGPPRRGCASRRRTCCAAPTGRGCASTGAGLKNWSMSLYFLRSENTFMTLLSPPTVGEERMVLRRRCRSRRRARSAPARPPSALATGTGR